MSDSNKVLIRLHSTLSERIGCANHFEVDANSIQSSLKALADQNPDLGNLILREDDQHNHQVNPIILIFLGDELIKPDAYNLNFSDLKAPDKDVVIDLIPAISGG